MLYKDMDNATLRTSYRELRQLAHRSADMGASGWSGKGPNARQMGRTMRNIEIIEAIADRRQLQLL